jgi:methyl-accepting chemotaxis protein
MSWLSQRSVGQKLFASFMSMLALIGVLGVVAIVKMASLNANVENLAAIWLPARAAAGQLSNMTLDYRMDEYKFLIVDTAEQRESLVKGLDETRIVIEEHRQTLDELCRTPEERQLMDGVNDAVARYLKVSESVVALAREGKLDEVESTLIGPSKQAREDMGRNIDAMVELNRQGTSNEVDAALSSYKTGRLITLATLAVSALLGVGLAWGITRWFTRAIVEVDDISNSVATASQELAAASQHLSTGAQESASSLEETASSLEEITATVRQNADNADQANQLANNSRETAEKGGAVVAQAINAMGEINKSSRKIADIITTIDEIAFQTNLLALNAAVEAARAGEQGRGFAVVAGEVRNLAQRSATAAHEIKSLIEDSVQKVETGSELVNKSGETLGAIVTSVKRVTDIVAEIAAASREQTMGIEQINKAVAHMDQSVQSTAAQMEELSGTATSLSGQSEQLQAVVDQFNLNRHAARAHTTPTGRSPSGHDRSVNKRPSRYAAPASPRRQWSHDEELVRASVGHDGFEEF